MRYQFLTERGFEVVCLHDSMDMEERKRVQDAFAKDLSACDAQAGGRLDVLRHGLDQDLIMLRTESLPAAKGGGS